MPKKSHHADDVDDNCYTSILWHHCVTWQPLYAILLFWFMYGVNRSGALKPNWVSCSLCYTELLAVSNATEICIWGVMLHCIYCMELCNVCCWYSNKLDLTWLDSTWLDKDRCPIPMDTTVRLGPLKFSLQATIDHHGPSIDSGHYTASINCCKKNILLQRSQNYGVWNYW